ncbi:MAG: RNA methyltransferase [Bacteroidota bacterium]
MSQQQPLVLILDNVRSGHNVGATFRLADAFTINAIYLCGITPHPPHREIRKTALGAEATVPWHPMATTEEAVNKLKEEGFYCVAMEQTERSLPLQNIPSAQRAQPTALIFGHEVWGISPQVLQQVDTCIQIPQYGKKKSLNVSTCIAITTWEWRKPSLY